MRRLSWLVAVAALAGPPAFVRTQSGAPTIVVSLDGWRWDYHTKARVPNLRALMARGVRAEALVPSFPTKTFPNHYTLVTGLYPGHHGIVGNSIRDPGTGRAFTMADRDEVGNAMWWGGEPIWIAVQRAGGRTAPMFWPGSEAPITGVRPTFWMPYEHGLSNDARVDRLLQYLDLPAAERPSFLTLYFSDVDGAGHTFGPASAELARALEVVDAGLGRLLRGLESRGLARAVNLVVTSDHGMSETSRQRVVFIDDYVTPADGGVADLDPVLGVWPRPGRAEDVYRKLATAHPRLSVYRKRDTPEHWHFRDHERIPPIVGVVDEGWSLMRRDRVSAAFAKTPRRVAGNHGYDPRARSMHTLFVAAGPAFRSNAEVPPFENVHVYELLCRLLGVRPAPNDGDPAVGRRLLAGGSGPGGAPEARR